MLQLGPRWSLKELRTFFILLKAYGLQCDKLKEHLPHRTSAMVRALFDMHRGYLSLSEASVEGFCTIMMDHYEMQDRQNQALSHERADKHEPSEDPVRNKKKRRLEKLLATDQFGSFQLQSQRTKHNAAKVATKDPRKGAAPKKARAWIMREIDGTNETGLTPFSGKRFDLPSSHWFYSFVDADFFHHNEFIECLGSMGLGQLTTAARPIWSSVRASMGRPRRLSPLFFTQEKNKLNAYRSIKRQLDPTKLAPDKTWPYTCCTPLRPGAPLLVWVESECRFQLATVAAVGATGETCQVAYRNTMPPVECSLDHVMVLEIPPWVGKKESCVETPKLALTTLRRREEEEYSTFAPPKPLDPIRDRSRDQKVRAVVAVKALLHRKERILSAMASLNERVAHDQKRLCEQSASLWTIPIAFSNDVASRERRHVQTQHAWLAANLKATNEHLQSALLHLQSFSTTNSSEPAPFDPNGAYDSDAMVGVNQDASETLTQSQLRWALDFLAASRQQASLMVEEAAARFALEDPDRARSSGGGPEIRFESVLPETRHLVAHCVTLMSILRAASVDVSPLVTQKLVDRALELLKPSHDANLDLYAEVYAAAHTLGAENPK